MDYARIGKLEESDFDAIVERAGGRRVAVGHGPKDPKNADYVLGEAMVELKLVEEEGLAKKERQRKVAEVFRAQQPDRPVVVLRPELLDDAGQRAYYSAMASPIQRQVKKASKQLQETATRMGTAPVRVLLLINNGYGALSHEEFKDIAFNRACNNTGNIDCVVVGGFYYYSDTFDMYSFERLESCPINADRPFRSFDVLRREWCAFVEEFMTEFVQGTDDRPRKRLPVVDLRYDLDGITYVKLAPPMGKPSEFWPNGRLRANSTGITTCPPIAKTFPDLDLDDWQRFRSRLSGSEFFKANYPEWLAFKQAQEESGKPTKPFVPIKVGFEVCLEWCKQEDLCLDVQAICEHANSLFCKQVRQLMDGARARSETRVVLTDYLLLVTEEIGQDKADDLSSIWRIQEGAAGSREQLIIGNGRMFLEHALPLTCAYACKFGVGTVLYEKDQTHAWV